MPHTHQSSEPNHRLRKLSRYVFFGFVAVALYFLIAEHRAHVVPFLPFLLLAACPLMDTITAEGTARNPTRNARAGHLRAAATNTDEVRSTLMKHETATVAVGGPAHRPMADEMAHEMGHDAGIAKAHTPPVRASRRYIRIRRREN